MYTLGITGPISWNNAAVLLKDGKLVTAAEEERFTRLKFAPRVLPQLTPLILSKKISRLMILNT